MPWYEDWIAIPNKIQKTSRSARQVMIYPVPGSQIVERKKIAGGGEETGAGARGIGRRGRWVRLGPSVARFAFQHGPIFQFFFLSTI